MVTSGWSTAPTPCVGRRRVYTQLLGQVQRWRDAGNPVVGIQIDFDTRTQYLHEYADFLRDLRQRLPADLRLSITGLMDWSSNADPAAIAQLKGVVDEGGGADVSGAPEHPGLRGVSATDESAGAAVQDRLDPGRGVEGAGVFEGE